jgi:hypothetical protein
MGRIGKRLETLERHVEATLSGARPVRINVVQEGPKGKEDEVEPLYSFILSPSGDEKPKGSPDGA